MAVKCCPGSRFPWRSSSAESASYRRKKEGADPCFRANRKSRSRLLQLRVTPVRYIIGMQGWRVKGTKSERRGWARESATRHRAFTIDLRAALVAKGRGAIDLALGETFVELCKGDRLIDLGCSRLVDYAYERLGIPKRTTFMLRKLATGLASRPLLRKAVAVGAVSARKALTVMSVAVGEDEAAWTGAAMNMTIAALERRIKDAGGEVDRSFEVETLILAMSPERQDLLDEAIRMAKEVIGANAARWMCLEAIAQEWMSSFADWIPERKEEASCAGHSEAPCGTPERMEKVVRAQLAALEEAAGVIAGMDGEPVDTNPMALDARAKKLAKARLNHDSALGPLLVLVVDEKIYKEVGYTRFEDYCRDRLGMTARAARQRVWLERKMCALPEIRAALKRGTITLTKALLLAKDANRSDVEARVADAATTTCQQVERESTEKEDRKNRALGIRRLWGPKDAMETVAMAITTAKRYSAEQEEDIDAEEALEAMSQLFVSVWTVHLEGRSTSKKRERVIRRTGGVCAVPTCQRPVEHLHHIKFRSQDGGHGETNLVGLCEQCHQRGVHRGKIVVTGKAGDLLIWKLGSVNGSPVEVWVTRGDDDVRTDSAATTGVKFKPPGWA